MDKKDLKLEFPSTNIVSIAPPQGVRSTEIEHENDTDLHKACASGDYATVSKLLHNAKFEDKDIFINRLDQSGYYPLHYAIKYAESSEDFSIVKLLLENGATLNSEDEKIRTLLHLACKKGDTETVKLILNNSSNIIYSNEANEKQKLIDYIDVMHGAVPLYYACKRSNIEIIRLLLEYGANPNIRKKDGGLAPLHFTVAFPNDVEIARLLIAHGSEVNSIGINPRLSPFQLACLRSEFNMAELLLENGADVNAEQDMFGGGTILHYLCFRDTDLIDVIRLIECLITKYRANIEYKTVTGHTPLHAACSNNPTAMNIRVTQIIDTLIKLGADINSQTKKGETPLHLSTKMGNKAVLMLILAGADPTIKDNDGKKPLDYATDSLSREILEKAEKIWEDRGLSSGRENAGKVKEFLSEIHRTLSPNQVFADALIVNQNSIKL